MPQTNEQSMSLPLKFTIAFSLFYAMLLVPGNGHAQDGIPDPGVRGAWHAPTLRSDVWSLNQNPSNLAFSEGFGALLSASLDPDVSSRDGYQLLGTYSTRRNSNGFALGLGGGLHIYRSFLGTDRTALGTTLAIATAFNQISFGLRYRLYSTHNFEEANGFHTGDFSMTARITRHFGASFGVENLWNPELFGETVPRLYSVGLGARTLQGRFGADISYRIPEAEPKSSRELRASISGVTPAGFRLYAQTRIYPYRADDNFGVSGGVEWTAANITTSVGAGVSPRGSDPAFFTGSFAYQSRPSRGFVPLTDSLLKIELRGELSEVETSSFLGIVGRDRSAFTELLWTLWQVADSELAGVYLHLSGIEAGPSQLYELRDALDHLRNAGKEVVVYVERGGLRDLIVAAQATWAAVPPSFYTVETGIALNPWFFGGLLEDLGVPAQFVATGAYKSGPERFTRSGPSDAAQEQRETYIERVYEFMVEALAGTERQLPEVRGALEDSPLTADELLLMGIIDEIAYEDELGAMLRASRGRSFDTVSTLTGVNQRDDIWISNDKIAVLHISGSIIVGQSGRNPITGARFTGSKSIEQAIAAISRDPRIEGLIIRVDSPGGSALASDEIRRGLEQLSRSLPTVISMGDIAASGGYYISTIEAPIVSTPVTLTGSIGVYAGTIAYQKLLEQFGIRRDRTTRGGPSDFFSGREWTDSDLQSVQTAIEFIYDRFLTLVAESRDLSLEETREVAGGRIWVGSEAQDRELVDHLGGFAAAYDKLCDVISSCEDRNLPLRHLPEQRALAIPNVVLAQAGQGSGDSTLSQVIAHVVDATMPGVVGVLVPYLSEEPGSAMLIAPTVWTLE
jgi:protease-4